MADTTPSGASEHFTLLGDGFFVSPQITPAEVKIAAQEGFGLVVNNRPDGEMPGQPTSAEIEAAAHAAGLAYVHIPVDGRGISMSHISALKTALNNVENKKTLAYCRSGTRSAFVRAYLQAALGREAGEIIAEAAAAGYDISGHAQALEMLRANASEEDDEA
ncbi:TIGR01244 family sulfur transferase [Hyphococcus sp.]|uniref:TIGR01244 family sulfur transferase n=1 Tax=Hyphococcus sp. TaxID=2038636 RepID=UPI002082BDB8|nr:MAG: TIGR01244 family protein [Marinicaulis sp.]